MLELNGIWSVGFAFDLHTLSSDYIGDHQFGHPMFDTTYSVMGALVKRLKFRNDKSAAAEIVEKIGAPEFVKTCDIIIPIPSSNKNRVYQPVEEIAKEMGNQLQEGRNAELENSISITNNDKIKGKKVLLVDDLFRSGSTLSVSTKILSEQGEADTVSVLTMTKTRVNR